jgi:hypothetical protein
MTTHNQSIVTAILNNRRSRRIIFLSITATIVSFAILYFALISPVLMPATITNPAVSKFISSKSFQEMISPAFDVLVEYNKGTIDNSRLSSDLYAIDPTQLGVLVEVHYKLIPRPTIPSDDVQEKNKPSRVPFRYEPEVNVRLSLVHLGVFILIEATLFFCLAFFLERKTSAQVKFEERELDNFFLNGTAAIAELADTSVAANAYVKGVLSNFHAFCLQLNERHDNRKGFEINDEYDVQDALHSLLRLIVKDVRPEDPIPSTAGASSRIDFLLYNEEIGIEVKMPRQGLKDKHLGEELIVDIARYSAHPRCKYLIFFVYDPKAFIKNPQSLREYVTRHEGGMTVDLIVSPAHYETV